MMAMSPGARKGGGVAAPEGQAVVGLARRAFDWRGKLLSCGTARRCRRGSRGCGWQSYWRSAFHRLLRKWWNSGLERAVDLGGGSTKSNGVAAARGSHYRESLRLQPVGDLLDVAGAESETIGILFGGEPVW